MKKTFVFFFLFMLNSITFSQKISGFVKGLENQKGEVFEVELVNASVYWANTSLGTITDNKGYFELNRTSASNLLVANYVGYKTDTIEISNEISKLTFLLKNNLELGEVVVYQRKGGQYISSLKPIYTTEITTAGLKKLPCCNLSESFENNASVDVSFSDAVSGAKQIQMLGLAGTYTQILTENMPSIRGLASSFGLAYIPGPWMESIQISKGTSSVINGYESITGQINVELKKPVESEKFYVNLFTNQAGRVEANLNSKIVFSDKSSTMILAHASVLENIIDVNKDGFLDIPKSNQINFINRWDFQIGDIIEGKIGLKILNENRNGGQVGFYTDKENSSVNYYGMNLNTKRYEVFVKVGFLLANRKETAIGTMYSATYHNQQTFFGNNIYNGVEKSFYTNIIFQTYIGNTNHKISTGTSFIYDDFLEQLNGNQYLKTEIVPGLFTQYTYSYLNKINLILGYRADYNSVYGLFLTPRVHFKYSFTDNTTMRISGGKGFRTANVFAENIGLLASSREIIITEKLNAEEAWNFGTNLVQKFELRNKKAITISLDFYRTDFVNQIIVDADANAGEVSFYNLNGKSYSNSFQSEIYAELIKGFDITAAFRINDVKVTMHNELMEKPLVNKYKGLLTLSYATAYDKWVFDVTNQFIGTSQLPNTSDNPVQYQLHEKSKAYYILHAQITRNFKRLEIYLGAENLTNFMQHKPIVAADDPFGEYFDSSIIWGPLMGRTFYGGVRFSIK
jgi:outer membrane receptor for ferrienterochelin and colicin